MKRSVVLDIKRKESLKLIKRMKGILVVNKTEKSLTNWWPEYKTEERIIEDRSR
jgi:hypothetical protein